MNARARTILVALLLSSTVASGIGQTCGEWIVVPNPIFEGTETYPIYIESFAPDRAVGMRMSPAGNRLLRMYWDGDAWTVQGPDILWYGRSWAARGLHANAPDDLWTAGLLAIDNFHGVPFLAHYDGQTWETHEGFVYPDPHPDGGDPVRSAGADSIVYFAPNDIWVIGAGESPEAGVSCPVASHWDGSNLRESMPQIQPVFGRMNNFAAADGSAGNDVWIVGEGRNVSGTFRLLTYHWDGANWTPHTTWTQLPGSDSLQDQLFDVVALSASDVWAVGSKLLLVDGVTRSVSLYLHWDGAAWTEIAGPDIGPATSIAAINANDIWVSDGYGEYGGRLAHFDGEAWTEFDSAPLAGATHIGLTGLAADPAGDVWMIGYWGIYDGQGGWSEFHRIIEHMSPGCDTPGDIDGDGDVDIADLAMLLAAFGSCVGDAAFNAAADIDQNGCVELSDLAVLLASFGS